MNRNRLYIYLSFIEIFLIVAIQLFMRLQYSLLAFANASFIIGLFALIIGLIIFVIQGGFFDFMYYSFKKVRHSFKKDSDLVSHFEPRDGSRVAITYPLIFSGIALFILSLILSLYV